MENELGFKLFERNSQGVRFTAEGQKFLAAAKTITDEYNQVLNDIAAYRQQTAALPESQLTMYASSIFTMSVLPGAITAFCKTYTQIKVCLLEDVSGSILDSFSKEGDMAHPFKIGLVTIPQTADDMQKRYKNNEKWRFVPLLNGEYVCCVSKKSPLAAKRNISLKTVCQYSLVRFTDKAGTQ